MRSVFTQLESTLSFRCISLILIVYMDVNKLISLVHVRTALWDKGDARHHNRYVLDKLWGEVAHELCSTSKYNSLSQVQHVGIPHSCKYGGQKTQNLCTRHLL
jgi:hypothetical protein